MSPEEKVEKLSKKLDQLENRTNTFEKALGSFGLSSGGASLLSLALVGLTNPTIYLVTTAIMTALAWPTTYMVANKIEKRAKEKDEKRLRCVYKTFIMLQEEQQEKDQVITQKTTNFYKKVETMLQQNSLTLEAQSVGNINDLLYLINTNYYEQIKNYLPDLQREQLLDKVIDQIGIYLKDSNVKNLTNKDIVNILNGCFFLKDTIKQDIIEEYRKSEVDFGAWTEHSIKNKEVDILDIEKYYQEKQKDVSEVAFFDIEDVTHYEHIIQGLISSDKYLSNFGDISSIIWDMESLKNVICIMAKDHRQELLAVKEEHCNFNLVTSFIYNAMCYGVMNKKVQIGPKELLATFKDWEYLPFDLRTKLASDIIEKQALEIDLHPFYKSKPKEKSKIIPISNSKKN